MWIQIYFVVYQELVSRGDGGLCTILQCNKGKNNLKAVDCSNRDSSILSRCGKWLNVYSV